LQEFLVQPGLQISGTAMHYDVSWSDKWKICR